MSRRKVSTLLDDHLFRRVKLESLRQQKQLSEIIGEALEHYLAERGSHGITMGVVAESWGILKLDRRKVDRLISNEDGLLDS